MKTNVGMIDRIMRVLSGLAFLYYGLFVPEGILLAGLGAILVFTGAAGWCPAYSLLGMSTVGNKWCDIVKK